MAETPKIAVIRTGLANLASVLAGFRRAGAEPFVTEQAADVERADYAVLPGVGAFGPAMQKLNETGIADVLRARFIAGRPTLSVCLGLQLLHASSEESPGIEGLGIIPLHIKKFPNTVRIPQLGWNEVMPESSAAYLQKGFAYFANSFHAPAAAEGWTPAHTTHGVNFVSAVERGAWLACQFHPELSGDWGLQLLKNWLSLAPERTPEAFEKREEQLPEAIDRFVQLVFKQAIHDGASEILFNHGDSGLIIRFRIKSVLDDKPSPPHKWAPHVVGKLKELAEINPEIKATKQVGEFALILPDRKIRMQAIFNSSHDGESVSILINPESDLPC